MLKTGEYLLDTNIVIYILNNKKIDFDIDEEFSNIYISSTVVGELMYGAYNSTKVNENIVKIIDFIAELYILDIDVDTSKEYGRIKSELKKKGKPIPENDIWIAACAIHNNLTLITNDLHFQEIDGLKLETLPK